MQEQNETQRLTTIRFSLPSDVASMVKNMKPIGEDLLVYVRDTDVKSVTDKFTGMGLKPVQREYKLHISAPSEEVFTNVFGNVEKEVRESPNKYVATVTVATKEEYDKLLELNGTNECRVKSFRNLRAKWTSSRPNDDDHEVQSQRYGGQGQSQRYSSSDSRQSSAPWQRAGDSRQSGSSWQRQDGSRPSRQDGPSQRTSDSRQSGVTWQQRGPRQPRNNSSSGSSSGSSSTSNQFRNNV